jgi:hypothetical protein
MKEHPNQEVIDLIPSDYSDKTDLIPRLILGMVDQFYHEACDSQVDWGYTKEHSDFIAWLKKAHKIITKTLPYLEMRSAREWDRAMPEFDISKPLPEDQALYCIKHAPKYEDLELKIKQTFCHEAIEYIPFFWT